ncbi:hypothetical protein CMQ_7565 [Grosmannia clavigera kw1407]|uniref:Uncharacterized protein n=1 Tax=Grosmannia clavigera (strain kw1407 / UAMH 11150) TaxID=655863 RepID=F0XPV7_GROCL|nr:uncharacterized protein CMQ_7565 [Grosmannia clavigera kw1407]EFX00563.1 hypothetical protein CMQ_7565 [Grosmannia clavigera kw1407]
MMLLGSVTATLPLLGLAAAGVAPRLAHWSSYATANTTSNVTTTASVASSIPSTNTTTTGPRHTSCDIRYCQNGTSYCRYWGGYTSFDISLRRPVPGETYMTLGLCGSTTANLSSVTVTSTPSSLSTAKFAVATPTSDI